MRSDVHDYCKSCLICVSRKGLSIVKDWVRQARAKNTSLLNISGIITHLVLILANVIALH